MEIGLNHFLWVSLLLFSIGLFGLMTRRNLLIMLMGVELMLNGVNLSFVAFSQFYNLLDAQIAAFFSMTISAGEAGVGLALIVLITRKWKNADLTVLEDG